MTDNTVIGSPTADRPASKPVNPVAESSGLEENNDPRAVDSPTEIPKTTDLEGTGTNEANLGQPVADASGDQTDDPNAPSYIGDEEANEVLDRQNETGVQRSGSRKAEDEGRDKKAKKK